MPKSPNAASVLFSLFSLPCCVFIMCQSWLAQTEWKKSISPCSLPREGWTLIGDWAGCIGPLKDSFHRFIFQIEWAEAERFWTLIAFKILHTLYLPNIKILSSGARDNFSYLFIFCFAGNAKQHLKLFYASNMWKTPQYFKFHLNYLCVLIFNQVVLSAWLASSGTFIVV